MNECVSLSNYCECEEKCLEKLENFLIQLNIDLEYESSRNGYEHAEMEIIEIKNKRDIFYSIVLSTSKRKNPEELSNLLSPFFLSHHHRKCFSVSRRNFHCSFSCVPENASPIYTTSISW